MLTELRGKGGRVCQPALDGTLRCPLIVRPNSEDVVTGNLFGTLGAINPRWWVPPLLNRGLKAERFRTQIYRNFRIELWQRQPAMPKHLVPWNEGQTEVDVTISWDPATTVFLEMKFRSDLSATTTHNDGDEGFPADQLIRNARIGLRKTHWYQQESRLFQMPRRDFVLLLVNATGEHPLVESYRDPVRLRRSIPKSHLLQELPRLPFIGCLGYSGIYHGNATDTTRLRKIAAAFGLTNWKAQRNDHYDMGSEADALFDEDFGED